MFIQQYAFADRLLKMIFVRRTLLISVCVLSLAACGSDSGNIDDVGGNVIEENSASPDTNTGGVDNTADTGTEANGTDISDADTTMNVDADNTDTDIITVDDTTDVEGGTTIPVTGNALTRRLTLNDNQQELNADVSKSSLFAVSNDSRYLLFSTAATNVLATGDPEDSFLDVYLRDTVAGSVTKVSRAMSGSSNDGNSLSEGISDDGRYSVFTSGSQGIHPGANGSIQVYLYDALSQSSTLISSTPTGDAGRGNSDNPFISANGDTVVFTSQAQNINDAFSGRSATIFAYDVASATISEVVPVAQSDNPDFVRAVDVSRDARYVVYRSGINTNNALYSVIDRTTNMITPVPDDINSDFGLRISDSGRYLVAQNSGSEERPVLWIDLQQNVSVALGLDVLVPNPVGPEFNQRAMPEEISNDGQTILYNGILFDGPLPATSENRHWNVYAISITELEAVLVSRGLDQFGGDRESTFSQFSNNEQSIVYHSFAGNLVSEDNNFSGDVFITPLMFEE